jgi:hypothetical protein
MWCVVRTSTRHWQLLIASSHLQLKLSLDAHRAFLSDGWSHADLAPRNFLVSGAPGARAVILFDLYCAHLLEPEVVDLCTRFQQRSLYLDRHDALEDHTGPIQLWAEENLGLEVACHLVDS